MLAGFLEVIGFAPQSLHLDRASFLDIVYQVGMLRKYPPIRNRFVDESLLDAIERGLRYLVCQQFHETAPYVQLVDGRLTLGPVDQSEQKAMLSFFVRLLEKSRMRESGHRCGGAA
ncbi:MAG: hypothetical protein QOI13_422 [Paraburkholderia sp.]|jgi:hypothetical protein|nr:hypothetical protein [Paraburkholderia sp.]